MNAANGLKYGVSLYSYTGDMNTVLTLDDAMAEIASAGATGIEILGESNIHQYPNPPATWVDQWWAGLEKHGLQPTNYCSWVDIGLSRGRDLSRDEGSRDPPQRHRSRIDARVQHDPTQVRRRQHGPGPAPRLGARSSRPTSTSPPSGTSSSARRSTPRRPSSTRSSTTTSPSSNAPAHRTSA